MATANERSSAHGVENQGENNATALTLAYGGIWQHRQSMMTFMTVSGGGSLALCEKRLVVAWRNRRGETWRQKSDIDKHLKMTENHRG